MSDDNTSSTRQNILVPSGPPSLTHLLITRTNSPVWWRHQLIPSKIFQNHQVTLPHSCTHYKVQFISVFMSPTQWQLKGRSTFRYSFLQHQVNIWLTFSDETALSLIFTARTRMWKGGVPINISIFIPFSCILYYEWNISVKNFLSHPPAHQLFFK